MEEFRPVYCPGTGVPSDCSPVIQPFVQKTGRHVGLLLTSSSSSVEIQLSKVASLALRLHKGIRPGASLPPWQIFDPTTHHTPCADGALLVLLLAIIARTAWLQVFSWAEFDVFALNTASGSKPVQLVSLRLLETLGVTHRLSSIIDPVRHYLADAEVMYASQPYHNNIHAADVVQVRPKLRKWLYPPTHTLQVHVFHKNPFHMQALGAMMALDSWSSQLTDIETLALVIAAAVHDLGHPGVTNDHHMRTHSPQALQFDNASVNESYHASLALQLLQLEGNNFTAGYVV
jgi:3'5'-cyclic nucleotide phosphodiesterase